MAWPSYISSRNPWSAEEEPRQAKIHFENRIGLFHRYPQDRRFKDLTCLDKMWFQLKKSYAEICTATIANLPTDEDGFKALRNKRDYCCRNHKPINIWSELNVCCVSVGRWSFYLVNWIYHWSKWRKLWGWSSSLKSSNTK